MTPANKDIDAASVLVEEDEESSLPELSEESNVDLEASGPLAAGQAALAHYAKLAPASPGVYRMLDARGEVLYVGKAKSIRKRILSYTRPTGHDSRIERVIAATASVEFVSTHTETEALLLEANLIKRLRPRFNVLLRDDKSFPYILITGDHWAPQILKHRGARTRQGRYYGPFASVWAVNRTITALERAFLLRSCSDSFFESRTRPCLLHQIKRCSGPCTGEIEYAGYQKLVREATEFLSGRSRAVKEELAGDMEKASAELDFERAAVYRDRLAALSAIQAQQGINPRSLEEADVFALYQQSGFTCIEVFFFRTGQNWGNRAYFPRADRTLPAGEVLGAFVAQFYDDKPCPRCVLVSHDFEERPLLAEALSTKSGHKIDVSVPQRGERRDVLAHALANAKEALGRKLADTSSQQKLLKALAEVFGLARVPQRIEVFDNSHIQGTNAVGAMIVVGPEGFRKNQYRKFNIRSDIAPGDDYGMMREMLQRRFKRLLKETAGDESAAPISSPLAGEGGETGSGEPGEGRAASDALPSLRHPLPQGEREGSPAAAAQTRGQGILSILTNMIAGSPDAVRTPSIPVLMDEDAAAEDSLWPDLLLIDGGQGQLTAARETLIALGLADLPLVAVAKGPDRDSGNETFFVPGRPAFKLPPRDPVLYFIERLRDEAHRFAIGSHRQRRKRDLREAGLQEIPGIGPTRKRALLRHFGTLKAIERASLTDLTKVPGINAETARKVYDFFHDSAA